VQSYKRSTMRPRRDPLDGWKPQGTSSGSPGTGSRSAGPGSCATSPPAAPTARTGASLSTGRPGRPGRWRAAGRAPRPRGCCGRSAAPGAGGGSSAAPTCEPADGEGAPADRITGGLRGEPGECAPPAGRCGAESIKTSGPAGRAANAAVPPAASAPPRQSTRRTRRPDPARGKPGVLPLRNLGRDPRAAPGRHPGKRAGERESRRACFRAGCARALGEGRTPFPFV
jgi:hypothetical protein